MSHPKLEEVPPPIITDDQLRALLDTTKGRSLINRRDPAIFRILIDTGLRRGELVGLTVGDVDLDHSALSSAARKPARAESCRSAPRPSKRSTAIYASEAHTATPIAPNCGSAYSDRSRGRASARCSSPRCRQAGIPRFHPHQFRHTAAHRWLLAGGQEQDLARITGWAPGSDASPATGHLAAEHRAREAHKRLAPGDFAVSSTTIEAPWDPRRLACPSVFL